MTVCYCNFPLWQFKFRIKVKKKKEFKGCFFNNHTVILFSYFFPMTILKCTCIGFNSSFLQCNGDLVIRQGSGRQRRHCTNKFSCIIGLWNWSLYNNYIWWKVQRLSAEHLNNTSGCSHWIKLVIMYALNTSQRR